MCDRSLRIRILSDYDSLSFEKPAAPNLETPPPYRDPGEAPSEAIAAEHPSREGLAPSRDQLSGIAVYNR